MQTLTTESPKPLRVLSSLNVTTLIVELSDGTFRWLGPNMTISEGGPDAGWVRRGLSAKAWDGFPSIEESLLPASWIRS